MPQRLSPREIGSGHPWKGFGMSIHGGVDVDNLAQGDLAIGAPTSGNVMVLKTLNVAFLDPSTEIEMDPKGAIKLEEKGKTH